MRYLRPWLQRNHKTHRTSKNSQRRAPLHLPGLFQELQNQTTAERAQPSVHSAGGARRDQVPLLRVVVQQLPGDAEPHGPKPPRHRGNQVRILRFELQKRCAARRPRNQPSKSVFH
uniref:(northern house mosquito) hypothetical protein n=1 Tax=Culex pipiens TaxID=7175 RepID=A0A8D8JA02_CULPI